MSILKKYWEMYKKEKLELKQDKQLIKAPFDGNYFKKLLNSLSEDSNRLQIEIQLKTGEKITIKREVPVQKQTEQEYYTKYLKE